MNKVKIAIQFLPEVIYATFLTIGFAILIFIIENNPLYHFFIACAILYAIFFLQMYSIFRFAKKRMQQLNIPIVNPHEHYSQLIIHAILPTLLYIGSIGFIFSNYNPHFWYIFLIIIFIISSLLFINTRAYYQDEFKLESKTHYVYDLIKLFVYFLLNFTLFSSQYSYSLSAVTTSILSTVIAFLLLKLNLLRYNSLFRDQLIYTTLNSAIIGFATYLMMFTDKFGIYDRTFLSFVLYYLSVGILHHRLHKTLNSKLILEYIVFALLAISLFITM